MKSVMMEIGYLKMDAPRHSGTRLDFTVMQVRSRLPASCAIQRATTVKGPLLLIVFPVLMESDLVIPLDEAVSTALILIAWTALRTHFHGAGAVDRLITCLMESAWRSVHSASMVVMVCAILAWRIAKDVQILKPVRDAPPVI
jgi:hypothetical protein